MLEPLYQYLEDHKRLSAKPIVPEGPEWPFVRAFHDGRVAEADGFIQWLNAVINMDVSPDGAENTEDSDE